MMWPFKRKIEETPRALAPKVTPYYNGRVTVAIDFTNEKDAVLALLYPTATPKLQAAITIINALKKPHKIELVITTTEGKT